MSRRHRAPPRLRPRPGRSTTWILLFAWLTALAACTLGAASRRPGHAAHARPSHALTFAPRVGDAAPAPAFTLTASDGTGLRLAFLHARVVVQGPLALTQVRLAFDNFDARTVEGRFDVTLPEGAALSRFAMKIDDTWQEGEVVERLEATRVYESFMHRSVDPALLEHDAGNRFRARVFPIPGRSRKELILSYTQELTDPQRPYRLPLLGLPHLDALYVQVLAADADGRALNLTRFDYVPEGDLVLREEPARATAGVRHGSLVAARVVLEPAPDADAGAPRSDAREWILLIDTSASQAIGFAERVRQLPRLLAALRARAGRELGVTVIGFDQQRVRVYKGPSAGFGAAQVDALIARGALGASDLKTALLDVARFAEPRTRVLLLGDGVATLGDPLAYGLSTVAGYARRKSITRIDAITAGTTLDHDALRAIATPADARQAAGRVLDGQRPIPALVDGLHAPLLRDVQVVVPGSRWVWPRQLDGVQPGDPVLLYAELDEGAPMRVQFPGAPLRDQDVTTTPIERPLLERAVHGAQLRELLARHDRLADDDPQRPTLRAQIIDRSITHRVLSPFTAMLVLETEADYQRFQLDRRGLSDILVVGDAGSELLRRALAPTLSRARARADAPPAQGQASPPPGQDTDRDLIPDLVDECPMRPEDYDGHEDEDGCPDLYKLDNCQIKLGDAVPFAARSAALTPAARRVLAEAIEALRVAPDVRVWIEGHTDARESGSATAAKRLAQLRALAVQDHLVQAGVAARRLEPIGWGAEKPLDKGRTSAGRARNRRVELSLEGCARPLNRFGELKGWQAARAAETPALAGPLQRVEEALARDPAGALELARAWWSEQPGDLLAALGLGRALAAGGAVTAARRAYGSLIDLSPSRAEFRRHAGQRFEALGAFPEAVDTYRQAARLRPDHPSSHRLLAFALARLGRHAEAFAALEAGLAQRYPDERFPGLRLLLAEDLELVAAAWIRDDPAAEPEVRQRLAAYARAPATTPSLRFVLTWETDASDLDLHVLEAGGEYVARTDWRVRADARDGYGPESLLVDGPRRAYPYDVHVHFAARGPGGYAMGAVQVVEHDGRGGLGFATFPFVVMREGASLRVGALPGPLVPAAPAP